MVFKQLLILLLIISGITGVQAQLYVMPGTSCKLNPGTEIKLLGINDSLIIDTATVFVNNGTVVLSPDSYVSESENYPITGTGTEILTKPLNTAPSNLDLNGLGITLSTQISPDTLFVIRGHTDTLFSSGITGIKRWYSLNAAQPLCEAQIVFKYDPTELNTLNESQLLSFKRNPIEHLFLGGYVIAQSNSFIMNQLDAINGVYSLAELIFTNTSNDLIICESDSLQLSINVNTDILQDTILLNFLDSLSQQFVFANTAVLSAGNYITSSTNYPSGNYLVQIQGFSPEFTSPSNIHIRIDSLSTLEITSITDSTCLMGYPILVTTTPSGGTLSGNFIENNIFYPDSAQLGWHNLEYTLNTLACINSKTDSIYVGLPPLASIFGPDSICENATPVNLSGTPIGGNFSGSGVTGQQFSPVLAQNSTWSYYTFTDSITGCTTKDSMYITLLTAPTTPVISNNLDTLYTGTNYSSYQWYLNGNPIAGADSAWILAQQNGDYTVLVIDSNLCGEYSDIYSFNSLGTEINDERYLSSIYPNPFVNILRVSPASQPVYMEITDLNGRVMQTCNPGIGVFTLDTSQWARGMYFVKIQNNNGVEIIKVIKK